ncbi:MAG TPA: hypothetical protein VMB80_17050 [Candidatus Acidoferrum sp.]|nr:hypothetical protein [Candidatus Acidoferrum sp.]
MQISSTPSRRNQAGYALALTLSFLVVSLIIFAAVMYWVTSSARVSSRNNLFNASQAAAQGATEVAISAMDRDFIYGSLNPSNLYMALVTNIDQTSWPVKYKFSDTNGNANQLSVCWYPENWGTNYSSLNAQFTGLYGAVANVDVVAMATPTNAGYNLSAIVENHVQLAAIPVFQFGVFYNLDLDFSPGQSLTMNGKVHCNGNIWMCPQANAYFNDVVEAALLVTNHDNPNDQQNLTYNASYVHYNKAGQPVSRVDSLNLPLAGITTNNSPTNVETLFNLPPAASAAPNAVAYNQTNQIYLYNECNLIISNAWNGTNGALGAPITIFYQDNLCAQSGGPLYQLTNNEICTLSNKSTHVLSTGYVFTNGTGSNLVSITWNTNSSYSTNLTALSTNWVPVASSFPFLTNVSFYDFREQDTVQAVQIDIGKLNNWLTNTMWEGAKWNLVCGGTYGIGGSSTSTGTKGHPIDSIFIYSSVRGNNVLPAVRVINGQQLPSQWGLTIATPLPIYTLGNYNIQTNFGGSQSFGTTNTAWTWPAALMGDAITILSGAWNDSGSAYQAGGSYSSRNAVNTTVNAACLEGIVQSTNSAGTKHYSGGLENFLRLLENWSGDTLTYNGSIVVMFPSIYATNYWIGPGTYYGIPTRNWGFDANFRYSEKSPPCAPAAKAIIRGNWQTSGK